MKISVIVPAFNEEKYIGECLTNLIMYAGDEILEIIVVNNNSSDNTAHIARKFPKVRVVNEKRKGLSYARQKGLMEAKGELLAYIDADTLVSKNWIKKIQKEFTKNKNLVCLSGPYIYYDLPKWQQFLVYIYWEGATVTYQLTRFMVAGGNFVAKKKALLAMGGFDTTVLFYGEDTNIARRISKFGDVKFTRGFSLPSSGRRLSQEGLFKVGIKYMMNYLSEAFLHKPATKHYSDIR